MTELKKMICIPSWLPDREPERSQRIDRLSRFIKSIGVKLPNIPVLIVAQNWKNFMIEPQENQFYIHKCDRLGILKARQLLRELFLKLGADYAILFDDDAIIQDCPDDAITEYLAKMDEHPCGFAFAKDPNFIETAENLNPYVGSQLNFCCISRYLFEKVGFPSQIDPQQDIAFEDRIFSYLLHIKYADKEFDVPEGVRSIHFKNPEINKYGGEVPSTWSRERQRDWRGMRIRTLLLERYIKANKDLPKDIKKLF